MTTTPHPRIVAQREAEGRDPLTGAQQPTCARCGGTIEWDAGDLAWTLTDRYSIVCVDATDDDGTDALPHYPATVRRRADELAEGMIVQTHGLRVQIAAPTEHGHPSGRLFNARGTILNPEYLTTDTGRYLYGGIIPLDGSSGWTIQGIEWVEWNVERHTTTAR